MHTVDIEQFKKYARAGRSWGEFATNRFTKLRNNLLWDYRMSNKANALGWAGFLGGTGGAIGGSL
jgi:hypothetical protein